ncbi:hypothetical protein TNIN_334811 [Trichonephila inaurata madagascariensis]|uniref:Uncharacterized protein n=1 Tax=Trichonephila inaurata madagascariensis TaxID=2747483 RepID=A0A8X7BRU2_9ARAC|nr:hypothetical protein TNIN_334811 [Trichonephila inaurata madagascariensis]
MTRDFACVNRKSMKDLPFKIQLQLSSFFPWGPLALQITSLTARRRADAIHKEPRANDFRHINSTTRFFFIGGERSDCLALFAKES